MKLVINEDQFDKLYEELSKEEIAPEGSEVEVCPAAEEVCLCDRTGCDVALCGIDVSQNDVGVINKPVQ